ncbi:unnamed protein product [Gongylonema pulchrum]|uniref:SET domain-containing protein n=1 Tax=Gongylonema pulchrum TaxID=637853 RepID=A0A183E0B4_9BILA|nr:unnamed protein product [Gongylonema pulchrum]
MFVHQLRQNRVTMCDKRLLLNVLPDNISWSRFIWAWHVVNTRCIYRENKFHPLVDNSQGDALAIVPLIDMLNHSNENQVCAVLWMYQPVII